MLLQKSAASSRRFIERLWKQLQAVSPQEEGCVSTPSDTDLKQGDVLPLQPWMRHLDFHSLMSRLMPLLRLEAVSGDVLSPFCFP